MRRLVSYMFTSLDGCTADSVVLLGYEPTNVT
jgi:hypothetical protein